jgi:hypothetical protein
MIYLPFKFELFAQQWTVRAANPHEITDLGLCKADEFEIVINPAQTAESMIHTLTHELVHSIEMKLQLELTERQVDLLALGLVDLLRNNYDVFDYITSEQETPE